MLITAPFWAHAQVTTPVANVPDTSEVYVVVSEIPEYPGGHSAMIKFLGENISYPDSCLDKDIQGTVYVSFVVNTDGSISDVKVVRPVAACPAMGDEAMRVVNAMPRWKPGRQAGRNVRTQYTLPLKFSIAAEKKK